MKTQDSEEELHRLEAAQGVAMAEGNQLRAGLQAATARLKVYVCIVTCSQLALGDGDA